MSSFGVSIFRADSAAERYLSDQREVGAVLRASERSYEGRQYFSERFSAHSADLSRSNGAYLTSLVSQPLIYVIQQVSWVGVLLACRGLPRWLLETHLILLHEELSAAIPKRAARYRKLLKAAETLRMARLDWIGQDAFDDLAARFVLAAGVGPEGVGALPVAAVCDECCGIDKAVSSLVGWLGDPACYSPRWCAALDHCLAEARALAGKPDPRLLIPATSVAVA
jgi:hypothetical protein